VDFNRVARFDYSLSALGHKSELMIQWPLSDLNYRPWLEAIIFLAL
jgi:hypothetical protein